MPLFEVDRALPAEIKGVEIGNGVDGAEQDFGNMMVKVSGQRTEEELPTDNGNQCCSEKAGFPVPDFPHKDEYDGDHQCPEDGWYPERGLDNLRPGCCSRYQAYNTTDKGEQWSPWYGLARGEEGHCFKPAVAREIGEDLFDLPKVIEGIITPHNIENIGSTQINQGQRPDI
ncbi:MAG: hypothetical protein BWY93_02242 [Euryarchaeota archaeon ADurb.BinA087]|nr:MAG: hypothetical protein BWY93_02242 [Euryarchaeota archaeon ADurb.BinA087]